ncbi:MAG TPA: FtsX-like permease family protein [Puia sp.]|nr:FtsX-like permease family protein [Puia sp.]
MFRNYLKIALRSLYRNKVSSFVNIAGLSVGIAVAILTGLWLDDELTFNHYHKDYARIAKVAEIGYDHRGKFTNTTMSYPLTNVLRTDYKDEFKYLVRASFNGESILSFGSKNVSLQGTYMDEDAPYLFSLRMIYGSRAGLKDMHSILLSQSSARAIFGDTDPIGQVLRINNESETKVTGVFEDFPKNTDLEKIKFIGPFSLWLSVNPWVEARTKNDWPNHFLKLYAELKPGTSFESVDKKIAQVEIDHIKNVDDVNFKEMLARKPIISMYPMTNWHLGAVDKRGGPKLPPKTLVWLVSLIGIFVLLLACINFMNLSTARSEKRAREVGIRKVIGSLRRQLIGQFFGESLLLVMLSFLIALVLVICSLGWFNHLADKDMHIPWGNPAFWGISMLFILATGLVAGSYPALFLSSFDPARALKGVLRAGRDSALARKVLVVFQFSISVALLNCTFVILKQIHHAQDRPVGYSREGLLMVKMKSADFYGKYELMRQALLHTGAVSDYAESMGKPTELASNNNGFEWEGMDPRKEQNYGTLKISPDYGRTVGWQVLLGRDFSQDFASDSSGLIINESAMKEMGIRDPIGKKVRWVWWMDRSKVLDYTIVGVVKDLVIESPYENSRSVVYYQRGHNGDVSWMIMRVKPTVSMKDALPKIAAIFKTLIPSAPFDYQFADEDYALKFAAEQRMGKLAGFFAALAALISGLGLLALASFTAEQRTKEIGVRKVLGASVLRIWGLLSTEFVALVLISLLVAIPVSYFLMQKWMENFQYRTNLPFWLFALSGGGAIFLALLTISVQTVRAALVNPVECLRAE